jgi:SnoaL-like domain
MRTLRTVLCAAAVLLAGCTSGPVAVQQGAEPRLADHQAIEEVLSRANMGFELSDADMFASAFATDGVYRLDEKGPVFGYDKMVYTGRDEIRTIISGRLEKARNTDPKTLSYDPASLRRFNRNSDDHIVILDDTTAKHTSTWMVVMHTNVNIHISAIGRYTDTLKKVGGKWLIVDRIRTE